MKRAVRIQLVCGLMCESSECVIRVYDEASDANRVSECLLCMMNSDRLQIESGTQPLTHASIGHSATGRMSTTATRCYTLNTTRDGRARVGGREGEGRGRRTDLAAGDALRG
jgi:hypothetical protein